LKRFYLALLVILFVFLPITYLRGDYLEVRRNATIYAEPNKEARIIEQVSSGKFLDLLDDGKQTSGYYHVKTISLGEPGWIYRTFVSRYPGSIPQPSQEAQSVDPLADHTLNITPEIRGYAARHLRLGKPQAVYERAREGYVLAEDGRLKIPLWVQYELSKDDLRAEEGRTEDFRPDTSIPFGSRSELEDYRGSEFDRGHMAPAADMKRDQKVMSESFLLSNMAPQVGIGLNRDLWAELEAAVRGWVEQRGTLTIITGPVFAVDQGQVCYKVIGTDHVAVPTHFYKIVVDANNPQKMEALAFLIPNENLTGRKYSEFLVSIDEIEAATGLDFLSALPAAIQNTVESHKAASIW
jgi:endonuclease G